MTMKINQLLVWIKLNQWLILINHEHTQCSYELNEISGQYSSIMYTYNTGIDTLYCWILLARTFWTSLVLSATLRDVSIFSNLETSFVNMATLCVCVCVCARARITVVVVDAVSAWLNSGRKRKAFQRNTRLHPQSRCQRWQIVANDVRWNFHITYKGKAAIYSSESKNRFFRISKIS